MTGDDLTESEILLSIFEDEDFFKETGDYPVYALYHKLGFVPLEEIQMPYMSRMKKACTSFLKGKMPPGDFHEEMSKISKAIRNDHVTENEWNYSTLHEPDLSELYQTNYPDLTTPIHNRLKELLGYDPDLEYSMEAEIYMQEHFNEDRRELDLPVGLPIDYEIAELVRYRQTYLTKGKEAADDLSLLYSEHQATQILI